MTEIQPLNLTSRAAAHPRCPLKCTRCGHIHEAQVCADPMTSEATGWFSGELRSPT